MSPARSRKADKPARRDRGGADDRSGARRRGTTRRNSRFRAPPVWLSAIALIVAGVSLLLALWQSSDRFPGSLFFTREQTGGSVATLQEMRDLAHLETLAYVRRSVFPHDFLAPHLTVTELLRKIASAGTTAAEALAPEELAHLRAINLSASLQLAASRSDHRFAVVTTSLIYGYDLQTLAADLEEALETAGEDGRVVYTLPPPQLLTVVTENISRANYPFPALHLDAEGWRRVTTFVEEHVTVTAPTEDLLRSAARNGIEVLRTLLGEDLLRLELRLPDSFPAESTVYDGISSRFP